MLIDPALLRRMQAAERFAKARGCPIPSGPVHLNLCGPIGPCGFRAADIVPKIRAAGRRPIHVTLNSEGGLLCEAQQIHDALREHSRRGGSTTCTVPLHGICASAGTVVLLACDLRQAALNARIMIHGVELPTTPKRKTKEHYIAVANQLAAADNEIIALYSDRTTAPKSWIRNKMKKDEWFDVVEAFNHGFIHSVITK